MGRQWSCRAPLLAPVLLSSFGFWNWNWGLNVSMVNSPLKWSISVFNTKIISSWNILILFRNPFVMHDADNTYDDILIAKVNYEIYEMGQGQSQITIFSNNQARPPKAEIYFALLTTVIHKFEFHIPTRQGKAKLSKDSLENLSFVLAIHQSSNESTSFLHKPSNF